jgi:hypothetical protein
MIVGMGRRRQGQKGVRGIEESVTSPRCLVASTGVRGLARRTGMLNRCRPNPHSFPFLLIHNIPPIPLRSHPHIPPFPFAHVSLSVLLSRRLFVRVEQLVDDVRAGEGGVGQREGGAEELAQAEGTV